MQDGRRRHRRLYVYIPDSGRASLRERFHDGREKNLPRMQDDCHPDQQLA